MRFLSKVLSLTVSLALAVTLALVDVPVGTAATISADARQKFVDSVVAPAQKAQRTYGVPASVSIAQAIEASNWGTSSVADKANNYFDTRCSASLTRGQFAALADAQVGKPYVLGAETAISNTDPAKFDCSELVEWLYGRSGNRITDLAAAQYNVTRKVTGSPKVGDLVFLRNNPARSNGIGHVAVLTKKLSNGGWRVIEARGRASGVVRTTLSYWKQRRYYAGLRRLSSFVLAGSDGVTASAASSLQSGCVSVAGIRYARYTSITNSFAAHAVAVAQDSAYSAARAVIGDVPAYVSAIARVAQPKNASGYAQKLNDLIEQYNLRSYDVVPFTLVLDSGDSGAKVSATQHLLGAAGYPVAANGRYDSATVSAVKKFQKAKDLEVDGEAGPKTLNALTTKISNGARGSSVTALRTLLSANGYPSSNEPSFDSDTVAAVKAFQAAAGRPVTGAADDNTWAALYMTLSARTPTITGTAAVGKKLTAAAGNWGPGSVSLRYQWLRGATPIGGATKTTYTPSVSDAGHVLSVRVTGIKRLYTTTVRTSAATATVPLLKLTATPVPTISGKALVGSTLTAHPGRWAPAPVALAYQWYRGTTEVAGATKAAYPVTTADAGAALRVAVTGTKTGYAPVTTTSKASATVPRSLVAGTPTITGTAKVGATLTARPGTWSPASVKLSYQWFAGSSPVKNATRAQFRPRATDLGKTISVRVTGAQAGYTTAARTSSATASVVKGTLITKTPRITGTRKSGHTIRVNAGNWGPGAVKLSYQWYRGTTLMKGATSTGYRLTSRDKGKTVSVVVTGRKAGYASLSTKVSARVAK